MEVTNITHLRRNTFENFDFSLSRIKTLKFYTNRLLFVKGYGEDVTINDAARLWILLNCTTFTPIELGKKVKITAWELKREADNFEKKYIQNDTYARDAMSRLLREIL